MRIIQTFVMLSLLTTAVSALDDAEIFSYVARGERDAVQSWIIGGGSLNIRDEKGNTPLLIASENGSDDIVSMLIAHGAEVNLPNNRGYTPIMAAVTNGHPMTVTALFVAGADIEIKNEYGTSAADFIKGKGFDDLAGYVTSLRPENAKKGPNSAIHIPLWEKSAAGYFAEGRNEQGVEVLSAVADTGDSYAQYLLGTFYMNSGYTGLAAAYLSTAADSGVLPAQKALSAYYLKESEHNPVYNGLRFKYLKMAADNGYPPATLDAGRCLLEGTGTAIDYEAAYEYFRAAKSWGLVDAGYYMGAQHYFGLGMPANKELGMTEITTAAAEGSQIAQEQLMRFATEQALESLAESTSDSRASIRAYLLSQGAVSAEDSRTCDVYDLSRFMHRDYGVYKLSVCDPLSGTGPNTLTFNVYKQMHPEYKEYLINYQMKYPVRYIVDGE